MSEPQPVQPLSYATYDADGLPEVIPEVEAMIDARRRPKEMRRHFRNAMLTAKYLAKSLRRRKSLENLTEMCEVCRGPTGGLYWPIEWVVAVRRGTFELAITSDHARATFMAHHDLCPACCQEWIRRANRAAAIQKVYRVVNWVLFGVLMIALYARIGPLQRSSYSTMIVAVVYVGGNSLVGLVTNRLGRRAIPRAVIQSLPRDVAVAAYHDPTYRERLTP